MYWQTTLLVLGLMFLSFGFSAIVNQKFRWVNTFNLVLVSLLIALSVILTNAIGYSRILFGKQVELGNFLILVIGMLFGPWAGITGAIASDLLGSLFFIGGTFHIGFMVSKVIFGLVGSLIFTRFFAKWWRIKLLFLCIMAILIQVLIIHPLSLYGTMVNDWTMLWTRFLVAVPNKMITILVEIIIYPFLSFISFRIVHSLYNVRHQNLILWSDQHRKVDFALPRLLKWGAFKNKKVTVVENTKSRG